MMSPAAMTLGQEAYYATLAAEDYYLNGGEPPGKWHGKGASRLGLGATVSTEQVKAAFRGFDPTTGEALVQHQKGRTRQPGWDLTFSAPKSVSVLWATLPEEEHRRAIAKAHEHAVRQALDYLESAAVHSRRGAGGKSFEHAELLFAMFEHGTSRAADPQLHTHALLLNAGFRASDSTWGALESKPLYEEFRFAAGSLYRMALATQLGALGYETVARNEGKLHSFELQQVPRELCEHFSKRRAQIESYIEEHGLPATTENFARAALYTRSIKGHVARGELFEHWATEAAQESGFTSDGPERKALMLSEHEQWVVVSGAAKSALAELLREAQPSTRRSL